MNGVLVIDKPEGPTSHDVVACLRRATGVKRVGHTGTLDPIASGVLALVIGRATRLAQFLTNTEKEYEARIKLGLETDTYDVTGKPSSEGTDRRRLECLSRSHVEEALHEFRGSFLQRAPPFSAKKIDGIRAYHLARRGTPVQPTPSPVSVSRLELTDFHQDLLTLRLTCSAGFYVRSLAHDFGERLGTGGCLQALRRLRNGEFGLDQAVPLDAIERDSALVLERLLPMSSLLRALPGVALTSDGVRRAARGNAVGREHVLDPAVVSATRVRLLDPDGQLVAIAEPTREPGLLHPAVVVV
jgi:tRNA pseudouridine55 synthase